MVAGHKPQHIGITKLVFDDSPEAHDHGQILGDGMVGIHAPTGVHPQGLQPVQSCRKGLSEYNEVVPRPKLPAMRVCARGHTATGKFLLC
jgi:hypothetical protein